MAFPPFCVVHANKAFCELSGLGSTDIIGKPVESLLHANQYPVTTAPSPASSSALPAFFVLANKHCTLNLIPVTDKFRNPSGGMSHLLVQLQCHGVQGDAGVIARSLLLSKNQDVSIQHHRVVGTVG